MMDGKLMNWTRFFGTDFIAKVVKLVQNTQHNINLKYKQFLRVGMVGKLKDPHQNLGCSCFCILLGNWQHGWTGSDLATGNL